MFYINDLCQNQFESTWTCRPFSLVEAKSIVAKENVVINKTGRGVDEFDNRQHFI